MKMDLFSLVSSPVDGEDDGDIDSLASGDVDEFETPRGSGGWPTASTPVSTPRSLFSTPPRSPPKTPPRPTSNVDERIRLRRYKLSMSPSHSPIKPQNGGQLVVEDPLLGCEREADTSFLTGEEDEDEDDWNRTESNDSYEYSSSTPTITPTSSPRKSDLLSLSPLQQRLARARTKRQQILEERVTNISNKSHQKTQQATQRKEEVDQLKITKARTEIAITQAKSKREQQLLLKVNEIEVKSKIKEEQAQKRKEDATLQTIQKARTELAKSPIAKERRDQQIASRTNEIESTLEERAAMARSRFEQQLMEKQRRASGRERKIRAEQRRTIRAYEKRAGLLAALDAKLERAAIISSRYVEEKAARAGEDVDKARGVARKVKAARVIQGAVRDALGIEGPVIGGDVELGQHDAAERLQLWSAWRVKVCQRRLFTEESGNPLVIEALGKLLNIFPPAPDAAPTFEELGAKMMQPETLKIAVQIVNCFRPINEVSFGNSEGSRPASPATGGIPTMPKVDGRTLLSLALIAVHPQEVLGYDDDGAEEDKSIKGSKLLAKVCHSLLSSLNDLLALTLPTTKEEEGRGVVGSGDQLQLLKVTFLQASTLFSWWKRKDLEKLLSGLDTQLQQSWVIYLTSTETLKYLEMVVGDASSKENSPKRDDPLMSLRLRHEASRAGSRSHIKRIRASLNKLVGADEGKDMVSSAKIIALKEIDDSNEMQEMKDEIDEIYGNMTSSPSATVEIAVANEGAENVDPSQQVAQATHEQLALSAQLPDELLSNRALVHKILLTDPADFDKLSWDGSDARCANITPQEFMASFLATDEDDARTPPSMEDMPVRIAESMRMAFFNQIAQEMNKGNFEGARQLVQELHATMRSLLPSRQDLHSHINDEDIASCSTTGDILRVLIRSGYLLATYLESQARAPTTRELIECVEAFNSSSVDGGDFDIPYEFESKELFVVASIAFILHKAELCQVDVSNYQLSQAAPLLHTMGSDYERKQFQRMHGDYTSATTTELQQMIPSTWIWIKQVRAMFGGGENLTTRSSPEQKMDFVKSKGFVDGVLFTRSQLALPEFLSLDVENINHIRSEARCCVIASALALHACNISKIGTSVLSSSVMSDDVNDARERLSSVLRRKHFVQSELESNVTDAVKAMTKALAERDLTEDELVTLKNHTLAVLHGNDPVLKLLDNRVQQFYRFACKWKSDPGVTAPSEMKTGRSTGGDSSIPMHGIKSTKEEFSKAAKKEASRLGFGYFAKDLIDTGNVARNVISLGCKNYGHDILEKLLSADTESNEV